MGKDRKDACEKYFQSKSGTIIIYLLNHSFMWLTLIVTLYLGTVTKDIKMIKKTPCSLIVIGYNIYYYIYYI